MIALIHTIYDLLTSAFAAVGVIALWLVFVRAHFRDRAAPHEIHFAETDDGLRLALYRYRPVEATRTYPVLLVHGLAASHATWDLLPGVSLARELSAYGYDVWAVDLRGHGISDRPQLLSKTNFDWDFDDYLLADIPAAIAHVKTATGRDRVHWIGHSMGGILGYAHLAIGGDRDLCSLTTIGSALDYTGTASEFHQLRRFLPWVRRSDGLRVRLLAQALAPLAGWIDNPIERFNFWAENVSGSVVRQYAAAGIYSVPVRLLEQLATAFEAGGLKSRDGGIHYRAELTQAACPTFAIAGDQDRQCPPPAAASTVAAITRAPTLFRVYGRDHACRTSYGHFDLIVGDRAPDEVWPDIVRWLNRHDGTADPTETSLA